MADELNVRLQQAIGRLPEQCRRVFELSRFEELKYQEIADQLGISIKSCRKSDWESTTHFTYGTGRLPATLAVVESYGS